MPLFLLKVKADLENIQTVHFNEDNVWKFDVESDSGEVREGITFTKSDELELAGSRGKQSLSIIFKSLMFMFRNCQLYNEVGSQGDTSGLHQNRRREEGDRRLHSREFGLSCHGSGDGMQRISTKTMDPWC